MVQEQITSINYSVKDIQAVFLREDGGLQRQDIILCGHALLADDGRTTVSVQALVWDSLKKGFFLASKYDSFLGLEEVGSPGDWQGAVSRQEREQRLLQRGAGEALEAIGRDMARNGFVRDTRELLDVPGERVLSPSRRESSSSFVSSTQNSSSPTPPPPTPSPPPPPVPPSSSEGEVVASGRKRFFGW